MQTDKNSVIGGYCPDQWEDTTGKKSSSGNSDCKDIKSGKPFLFFRVKDEIQFIKHNINKFPFMKSNYNCLMEFGYGLLINTIENNNSYANAYARNNYWVHP